MENSLLKLVLLEDIYGCCLSAGVAESLFGHKVVAEFLKKYQEFEVVSGYIISSEDNAVSSKWIKDCDKRKDFSVRKLEQAIDLLSYLKYIPWVKFAAVSGSVAFMSADENDDIDIFLVTASNRLWLVRGFELILFRVLGVRRKYGDTDVRDSICINYYITEDKLDLKKSRGGDFLTALEIVMMKPVYKKNYWQSFLSGNSWVKDFFPGLVVADLQDTKHEVGIKKKRWIGISLVFDVLDRIAMWLQIAYMKVMRHPYSENKLELTEIRFFPPDGWDKRKKMLSKKLELYDLG